jgi:hypothetical protein
MESERTLAEPERRTLDWRRERLVEAGFAPRLATRLSHDARYDLHALIELVERGCDPELAVRIVAPLDLDGAA